MTNRQPSKACLSRINKDVRELQDGSLPGVYAWRSERYTTIIDALIIGPFETPYECGFFHFLINCPDDYPHQPPKVKLLTTGHGGFRFGPNLYANGKVCLSILGTWSGPSWTSVQTLSSVLLSIQSLLCEFPYRCEPGFENAVGPEVELYNHAVRYQTLRLAVCDMASLRSEQHRSLPEPMRQRIKELFLSFYEVYELNIETNATVVAQLSAGNNIVYNYDALFSDLKLVLEEITTDIVC